MNGDDLRVEEFKAMKRVFLYARVSTEEQAVHGLSIEAQTRTLEEWAKANGHKVVGTYVDAGISARKPASKRPALQKLLADAQAGKGELIVFTKLDRWFRNIAEYYKVQEILERCHVDWRTIHEDYDTSTASGRLKINIMLSVAQDEADRTSERIKAINEMKRQKLQPLTGVCPYGYKIKDKQFIKDTGTEKIVSAFFDRFLATGSVSDTQDYILERYGVRINYQKAHKMLDMTCYCGSYYGVDGMTPPYISMEQFQKIQSMRRRVVRKSKKNRVYIFSGLIVCGSCGRRMSGGVNTNQESFFYNCQGHYQNPGQCKNGVNISERKIEEFLKETIRDKMERRKIVVLKAWEAQQTRDYKGELAVLRAKLGRLKELYLNDLITLDEYKDDQAEYAKKIQILEAEVASQEKPDFSGVEKMLAENWETLYDSLEKKDKREFWRILIKEITIYPDRRIEYEPNI